jgi:hypothetical protein
MDDKSSILNVDGSSVQRRCFAILED